MLNRWEILYKIAALVGAIMLLVVFWDFYVLNVQLDWHYKLLKGSSISLMFFISLIVYQKKESGIYQNLLIIAVYLYSFYCLSLIDMSYFYSFIEVFIFSAFVLPMRPHRFFALTALGYLLFLGSLFMANEPAYITAGHSFKPHALIATTLIAGLALVFHWTVTRYREEIMVLNHKFALIGKQSSFLMHEIKNPLSRVVQSAGLIATDAFTESIKEDSMRISSIIHGVDVLTGNPTRFRDTFESFHWAEIIQMVESEFGPFFASNNISFATTGFEGLAFGNKYLLYQVFKNLVTNAIEATSTTKKGASIFVSLSNKNGTFIIEFYNSNSSIPKNIRKDIFEPLFTTKKNSKNKGLGLAFAKTIIEAHQGGIEVESKENSTTFYLRFSSQLAEGGQSC